MIASRLTSTRKQRRLQVRDGCVLLMAGILTLGACDDEPSPTELSSDVGLESNADGTQLDGGLRRTYDGRDLFRGLLLSDGPVAALLPRNIVQQYDRDDGYSRKVSEVMAVIDRADPEFFEAFGRQVNSGDRYRMAEALDQGARRLFDALELADGLEVRGTVGFLDPGVGIMRVLPIAHVTWIQQESYVFQEIFDPTGPLVKEKIVDQIAGALGA